ncbi:hypothetical protein AAG906_033645 [Vitis piasezkii]
MGSGDKGGFLERCDVSLGLKMQSSDCKRMMLMPHQYSCHYQCDGSGGGGGDGGGGGGGGGDGGPIFCNTSNLVASMSDIYDVVGAGAGAGAAVPRTLHPFTTDTSIFKSTGGMAASLRVPFTAAQWQELERQTMIYKYMMASVPIPPELLIPISRSLSDVTASHSNRSLDLRFPNNSDPEPWRCRRTDGKKWRCSRDVAPDQKYCERHTHKGRPRSRKPVELHSELINNSATTTATTTSSNNKQPLNLPADTTKSFQDRSHLLNQTEGHHTSAFTTLASAPPYGQVRCPEWFTKGDTVHQQWQQLMLQSKHGVKRNSPSCDKNGSVFKQRYDGEPLYSSSFSELSAAHGVQTQRLNYQCGLLLSPKLASFQDTNLNQGETQTARDFIDAWSTAERGGDSDINEICNSKCPVSSRGKLPLSSLTLSMCGGDGSNGKSSLHGELSPEVMDLERENGGCFKSQPLNWMNPVPWMASPPGGPLAEALCLGMASTVKPPSNAASVHGGSSSTTTTSSSSRSSCGDGNQGLNLIN